MAASNLASSLARRIYLGKERRNRPVIRLLRPVRKARIGGEGNRLQRLVGQQKLPSVPLANPMVSAPIFFSAGLDTITFETTFTSLSRTSFLPLAGDRHAQRNR